MPKEVTRIGVFLVFRGQTCRSGPFTCRLRASEFDPSLEGDHAWRAVTAQPHAQQSGRRGNGAGQGAKAGLRGWLAWSTRLVGGQSKVGVVEEVEELGIETEACVLGELDSFCQVEFGISEMRSAV